MPSNTSLSILAWNIHGLPNVYHQPLIEELFHAYDILFFSETWTRPAFFNGHTPHHFKALTSHYPDIHTGPARGGIALYYKADLKLTTIHHSTTSWKPIIWITVNDAIFGFAYLPPVNSNYLVHWELEPLETLMTTAEELQNTYQNHQLHILGDLNARRALPGIDTAWNSRGRLLHNLTTEWHIHATGPTHLSIHDTPSCIDYILSSTPTHIIHATTLPYNTLSDHHPLSLTIRSDESLYHTPEPLPHTRPPPPTLLPIDLREQTLMEGIPPPPQPSRPFDFTPDTTALNTATNNYKRLLRQHQQHPTEHSQLLYKQARNLAKTERRRIQAQRKAKANEYWSSLSTSERAEQTRKHIRGDQGQSILASGPELVQHYQALLHTNQDEILPYEGDGPANPLFSAPFTEEELTEALLKMKNSATGENRVSAHQLRKVQPQILTEFYNDIIKTQQVPTSWRRSILVAIPKGSDTTHAANTRGIALQSAHRKLYTLILLSRTQQYLQEHAPLPPLQNGFQPGKRTADNIFVLRTLHEQALHHKQPLLLAQIDIQKAFDSVDRAKLFSILYNKGIHGPLIEVLRQAYLQQTFAVRANKRYSDMIQTDAGVPQGDPLSPLLFIIYMSGIEIAAPDDPTLDGHPIQYLALADDFTVVASSPPALQTKLHQLCTQCRAINLTVNPLKCGIFTMGTWTTLPFMRPITIDGLPIKRLTKININGYTLSSDKLRRGWDSDSQAKIQNQRAAYTFRSLYTVRHHIGITQPIQFRNLYRSLVESQYSYAIESRFDVPQPTAQLIDLTQRNHLRTITGLHPRAITNIIFRDLQILPLSLRALLLTTKFYQYAHNTPPTHPVQWAIQTQRNLPKGWYHTLKTQLAPLHFNIDHWIDNPDLIPTLENTLWRYTHDTLLEALNSWPRMDIWKAYGLRPIMDSPPIPRHPANYLLLPLHLARACARLRTASHNIGIQRFRMNTRHRPRHARTCPHCPQSIETEYHALIICPHYNNLRHPLTSITNPIYTLLHNPTIELAQILYDILKDIDQRYPA